MDDRLTQAVAASAAWYAAIFRLHKVAFGQAGGLWAAHAPPPPLHSAVKTMRPGIETERVLAAQRRAGAGGVADSFGDLPLDTANFTLLFESSWIFREAAPPRASARAATDGWSTVRTAAGLAAWTARHDTSDVLLPGVLDLPNMVILEHRDAAGAVTGVIAHRSEGVVSISNIHATAGRTVDWPRLTDAVAALYPGHPLVGYERGPHLKAAEAAGFHALGPQRVWVP
jgi:hypothetical protein